MNENLIKDLEKELEASLEKVSESIPVQIDAINKILNQEYEKEIGEQVNFLRNITIMAGTVAPFSLTLLSIQSLGVQKAFLVLGFVTLLIAVLVALLSSKMLTLDNKFRDTSKLAFDHIMAKCSADVVLNPAKPLSERVDASVEILTSIDSINNNFTNLGYTNKLAILRNRLSLSNQWSVFLFSFGIIFIIVSVVYTYLVNTLSFLIIYLC